MATGRATTAPRREERERVVPIGRAAPRPVSRRPGVVVGYRGRRSSTRIGDRPRLSYRAPRRQPVGDDVSQLADRVAGDLGWGAVTFTLSGCGTSEGDFALNAWLEDLQRGHPSAGVGVGLADIHRRYRSRRPLGLAVGASNPDISGVAALAPKSICPTGAHTLVGWWSTPGMSAPSARPVPDRSRELGERVPPVRSARRLAGSRHDRSSSSVAVRTSASR